MPLSQPNISLPHCSWVILPTDTWVAECLTAHSSFGPCFIILIYIHFIWLFRSNTVLSKTGYKTAGLSGWLTLDIKFVKLFCLLVLQTLMLSALPAPPFPEVNISEIRGSRNMTITVSVNTPRNHQLCHIFGVILIATKCHWLAMKLSASKIKKSPKNAKLISANPLWLPLYWECYSCIDWSLIYTCKSMTFPRFSLRNCLFAVTGKSWVGEIHSIMYEKLAALRERLLGITCLNFPFTTLPPSSSNRKKLREICQWPHRSRHPTTEIGSKYPKQETDFFLMCFLMSLLLFGVRHWLLTVVLHQFVQP